MPIPPNGAGFHSPFLSWGWLVANKVYSNIHTPQFAALHDFIDDSFDNVDLSNPQAYLVYMYFSQDSMLVQPQYSGIVQVGEPN